VIAVSNSSEYKTLADLLKAAKADPGKLSYGSTGPASTVHIVGELLKRDAGADLTYVPFPGSPPGGAGRDGPATSRPSLPTTLI